MHFGALTNSHTCYLFCHLATMVPKKSDFCSKITFWLQNRIFAPFATLGPKVHFLRKNALLRPHAADAYKTNGTLMEIEPLLVQKRFWAEKCILGSKIDFGLKMRKWTQNAFWAQKCFFRKSDKKVNDGLHLVDTEPGFPDSGPDSIHGRPGLLKHVAFSVPLHSNNVFCKPLRMLQNIVLLKTC